MRSQKVPETYKTIPYTAFREKGDCSNHFFVTTEITKRTKPLATQRFGMSSVHKKVDPESAQNAKTNIMKPDET